MIYPARLVPDSNATMLARFPDFPEAATLGADDEDALLRAQDALLSVIAARIDDAISSSIRFMRHSSTISKAPFV